MRISDWSSDVCSSDLRSGLYPLALPSGLGCEGAGEVVDVGDGVGDLRQGDRVAYASGPLGAYAAVRLFPADKLVRLPDGMGDRTAAALMLQGMTVQYLILRTYSVQREIGRASGQERVC